MTSLSTPILTPAWSPVLSHPVLSPGDVAVWQVSLDSPTEWADQCHAVLSVEEKARADRFIQPHDRARFVATHGALRFLLAQVTGRPPSELVFAATATGKPFLVADDRVRFNLSHSQDLALIAIAYDLEVGIDLDHFRTDLDVRMIADQFFSPAEASRLGRLTGFAQQEAFLFCWTAKEALVKATGSGLAVSMNEWQVEHLQETRELRIVAATNLARPWFLYPLEVDAKARGALAVLGRRGAVRFLTWSPKDFDRPRSSWGL